VHEVPEVGDKGREDADAGADDAGDAPLELGDARAALAGELSQVRVDGGKEDGVRLLGVLIELGLDQTSVPFLQGFYDLICEGRFAGGVKRELSSLVV
jgi:hypothetical protein